MAIQENKEVSISKFINETLIKLVDLQTKYHNRKISGETYAASVGAIIENYTLTVEESKSAAKHAESFDKFLESSGIYNDLEKIATFGV